MGRFDAIGVTVQPRLRLQGLAMFAALVLLAAGSSAAFAQDDAAHAWDPRTGDAWTDARMADVNTYAARYPDAFVDELVRYFDLPRALADDLLGERRWAAGDVYYACALARVAGRPCRATLDAWAAGHAQGWAPIAEQLGVAPKSAEATRLRMAFVDSYGRWARPLPLDAGLAREVRNRDRALRREAAAAEAAEKKRVRKLRKD